MTNLTKLNKTVDHLEEQAEMLKQNNKVLAKISELSSAIEKGANELVLGNKAFDKTKKDIQASLSSLDISVGNLEKSNEKQIGLLIASNNKKLHEFGETVSSKLEKLNSDIRNAVGSLNDSVINLEKSNEKHIDLLITSNKKFLREFEDSVSSKLERFSSDIQVTIRQERTQLQDALLTRIATQFSNLESKQKDFFTAQAKQTSILKILLIIVIAFCLGIGIILLIKGG